MRVYDLIYKKRLGLELSTDEIKYLLLGYARGEVPDYQMAAWAMAVCLRGMSPRETTDLTLAMVESGDGVDLGAIPGIKVDKHSTGGVGDTTSLVLVPLVASCGAPVAKMSGRGLGHTGGTVDKLESIPGFQAERTMAEIAHQVNEVGCVITGQTAVLVPADKNLYALRDVTATVDSTPLIAASIMSKKIAGGADAIVLDVKAGTGAFMESVDDAFALAHAMVEIGTRVGRETVALVTDMDQPLGHAVGNALEVYEAIETLRGFGPPDLVELCLALGSQMLLLARVEGSLDAARDRLSKALKTGKGLAQLKAMVQAQGGDITYIIQPIKLPRAAHIVRIPAPQAGYVHRVAAREVGAVAMALGAGRQKAEDPIDLAVGVVVKKKVGDQVKVGETLAEIHATDPAQIPLAAERLVDAFAISETAPPQRRLIYGVVTSAGAQRF